MVYLPGASPLMINPLDFRHTTALMVDAYEQSRAFLETTSVNGPGLYQRDASATHTPGGAEAPPTPDRASLDGTRPLISDG